MRNNQAAAKLLYSWFKNASFDSSVLYNEKELLMQGDCKVLELFHRASERVPAYKDFLKKNRINPLLIKTISDFKGIPVTTKENYIEQYSFTQRSWDGNLSNMHMISTSSGTTGSPHFWPRNLQNEIEGAYIHELLFRDVFGILDKKTLFINGFALGNWIAGTFTSACVNLVAWKGYSLTLMSPGYVADAIIEILEKVASEYEQIIISGHVPFLKEIVELAVKKKIKLSNIKLLGTGQGITENWREYLLKILGSKNYFNTIINLYGSADAALMGFETPFSILLRKVLSENHEKKVQIFQSERLPSLYNFDPRLIYFEAKDKELCITKNLGCPLIRYNIYDEGGVISYREMLKFFDMKSLDTYKTNNHQWQLPFVYLFGRDKFMVKIYGANVYSEHVQLALNHERLQKVLTGRYILEMDYNEEKNPVMIFRVELNSEVEDSPELVKLIQQVFVDELKRVNSEYNFVLEKLGDKVKPQVILYEHGNKKYFPKGVIKKTS